MQQENIAVRPLSHWRLALLVVTCLTGAAAAADVREAVSGPSSPTRAALAERDWADFDTVDRTYREAIRQGIAIEDRVAELKADSSGSKAERAARLYLASLLQWRHGWSEAALASVDEALKIDRYGELLRHRGRLLDASGELEEAMEAYREAVPLLSGDRRLDTELRLALLVATEGKDPQPLLALAARGDENFNNRIALLLAVLGHPGDAFDLYALPADADEPQSLCYYLRLTEWALTAQRLIEARETAWQALGFASATQDRLYTLALLTEAYRQDDALPELVQRMEAGDDLGDDARALWVSLLRELDRPKDALAALEGSAEAEPPAVKRQLVGLYRESGDTADMVSELERLMAADPNETIWPQGLAEFYLERGDEQAAEAVWQSFVERSDDPAAQVSAARTMQLLNLDTPALDAATKAQQRANSPIHGAMFRFELHRERGRYGEAAEVLGALEDSLSADDPARRRIALAYERLGQPRQALRVMEAFADTPAGQTIIVSQYVAELLTQTGAPDEALARLLAAAGDAPAPQRRVVYTRIIAAAKEAGTEAALAADLTQKLRANTAAEWELQLLLEMHVRANETDAALAVVDTLSRAPGADPVEILKRLAAVHRSLGNWLAYDEVLAQLAEQDPADAMFHIRARIINYLENLGYAEQSAADSSGGMVLRVQRVGQEPPATIAELLRQYSAVSGVGADREFQAGVLAMAGEHEQAVAVYREVLAHDPSRLDNYLAIGNQLTVLDREAQAIGMYQYLVEAADREALSWAALDGIMGLEPAAETLRWGQRRVLERLAAAPDTFAHYRQLADLSSDLGNNERELAALHNGLAAEPQLRMPILRELLRLTASTRANQNLGAVAFGGQALSLNERHVVFGRRLLALGLQMPPDVYVSLGKAMLEAGDSKAALTAVNQAVENTGRDVAHEQLADMFRRAGDELAARRLFEQALTRDPGNIGLILDTAWSSERLREDAGALYRQGLALLLGRQPFKVDEIVALKGFDEPAGIPAGDSLDQLLLDEGREAFTLLSNTVRTHPREYRQYYVPLRNGLVRVLAGDPARRDAVFGELQAEYRSTLEAVRAEASVLPRLAHYPRLERQAQLLRYLAYAFADYAVVNELDETLLSLFPEDPILPEILVSHRTEWGSAGYLEWLKNAAALTDAQKRRQRELWLAAASDSDDDVFAVRDAFGTTTASAQPASTGPEAEQAGWKQALEAAIRAGDEEAMLEAARKLAATELIWDMLTAVAPHLSASGKRTLAEHIIPMLRRNPRQAANSLRVSGGGGYELATRPKPWAAILAEWSGERVLDDQQILAIVTVPIDEGSVDLKWGKPDVWFVYHTLSPGNRETWLKNLLKRRLSLESREAMLLVTLLLQVPADPATAEQLRWMVREHEGYFAFNMLPFDSIDIHADNVPLARELAALVRRKNAKLYAEHLPDPVYEPNFLRCEGRLDEALDTLLDIYFDGKLPPVRPSATVKRDAIGFIDRYYSKLVAGNERRLLDKLEDRNLTSTEQIRQRGILSVHLHLLLPDTRPDELAQVVLAALDNDPANVELLQLAADLHTQAGQRFAAYELTRRQLEFLSADEGAWQIDNRRPALLRQLIEQARALGHPLNVVGYREALGQDPSTVVAAARPPAPSGSPAAINHALRNDDRAALEIALTRLWQGAVVSERTVLQKTNTAGGLSLRNLAELDLNRAQLQSFMLAVAQGRQQGERPETKLLLSALAEHPLGVDVLEAWLTSVRGRLLGQVQALIDALAAAHVEQGSAAARFDALTAVIRDGYAGDRELSLWLALGSLRPELAERPEVATVLRSQASYRPSVLPRLAWFQVAAGDQDGALKSFQSLLRWAEGRDTGPGSNAAGEFSLGSILASARSTLDTDSYRRLLRDTLDRVKPREDHLLPAYSEFVLAQFHAADDRQAFSDAFAADLAAALDTLGGGEATFEQSFALLLVADTYFELAQMQAVLETLKHLLLGRAEQQTAVNAARVNRLLQASIDPRELRETMAYRNLLGGGAFSLAELDLSTLQVLLRPDADLSALIFQKADAAWLEQADSHIRGWLAAGESDRKPAIDMLLSLARAYHAAGGARELRRLFAFLETQLGFRDELTPATLAAIVAVADELGQTLDQPALEKDLLTQGAIPAEHMAASLRRIAAAEGNAAAIELGKGLLEFTLQDELLSELIALAEAVGNRQQAEAWRTLQGRARAARQELERMGASVNSS